MTAADKKADEALYERLRTACAAGQTSAAMQCIEDLQARQLRAQYELDKLLPAVLGFAEQRFRCGQEAMAQQIATAMADRDQQRVLALLDQKLEAQYRPLHDILIDFKASGYDWVLTSYGQAQLRECQIQLAASQKDGFTKWEEATVEDHVRQAAYLFALHLGRTRVLDEPDRYRFVLDPCGTGGRMAKSGSLTRPVMFHERVPGAHDFTFGRADFPAYCAHCASWNGIAAADWFGHPQWVFAAWQNPGDPCGYSIYKDPNDIPEARYRELGLQKPRQLKPSTRGAAFSSIELEELGTLPSDRLRQVVLASDWDRAQGLAQNLAKEYVLMIKGLRLVLEAFAAYNAGLFERRQREAFGAVTSGPLTAAMDVAADVDARHQALLGMTRRFLTRVVDYLGTAFGQEAVSQCYAQLGTSTLGRAASEILQG